MRRRILPPSLVVRVDDSLQTMQLLAIKSLLIYALSQVAALRQENLSLLAEIPALQDSITDIASHAHVWQVRAHLAAAVSSTLHSYVAPSSSNASW